MIGFSCQGSNYTDANFTFIIKNNVMSPGGDGDGAVCLLIYRNYVYPTFGSGRLYSESIVMHARTHSEVHRISRTHRT